MTNWQENNYPFKKFSEKLTQEWIKNGFNKKETREWLESGLKANEFDLACWLVNIKKKNAEWFLNKGDEEILKEEYKKFLEEVVSGHKLTPKVIRKLKEFTPDFHQEKFPNELLTKWYKNLPSEKKLLIDELVPNEELKENYKKYGLCRYCQQPNTGITWCQSCNYQKHSQEFSEWTSGNSVIDEFIRKHQLRATSQLSNLEWIPYEQFENIKYLAEGGFSRVYKAKWTKWNNKSFEDLVSYASNSGMVILKKNSNDELDFEETREILQTVVLKILHKSQNVSANFLQEISNYKLMWDKEDNFSGMVQCYGISQDPETKSYVIVMQYVPQGNLRQFLQIRYSKYDLHTKLTSQKKTLFRNKLNQLLIIAEGLKIIHKKKLVHKDLHPGNVLCTDTVCLIADLGLCCPASERGEKKIYGVLPYVAPEILRGQNYTQAADIYSFGVIASELLACESPYYGSIYDENLAAKICQGLRPYLIKVPSLLEKLIKKCWSAYPLKRPNADKLEKTIRNWLKELNDKNEVSEFYQQYLENAEEFNKVTPYKSSPSEFHTSRPLNFSNLLQPQNNHSQEWQTTTLLDLQIKSIENELVIIQQNLNQEQKELVNNFIKIKKQSLKDQKNQELEEEAWNLEDKLEEKLAREKIDDIIRHCEDLVKLEEQQLEKLNQQLSQVEVSTNK